MTHMSGQVCGEHSGNTVKYALLFKLHLFRLETKQARAET